MTGRLYQRLELQERILVPDGGGGFASYFDTVTPNPLVYAQITQISGMETMRAGSFAALQVFRIIIRYRDNVTSQMRLRDGNKIYDIRSVTPVNGRRHYLEIIAELTA